jgi:opacity protein-like surface antigen
MTMKFKKSVLAALCAWAATAAVQAGEVYGNVGLPGVMLGYAQPVSPGITVRGDLSTIGSISRDGTHSGIDFNGKAKLDRVGVFADWFALGNGFRLTGGLTYYDASIKLAGRPNTAGTIDVGDNTYAFGPNDRFDVSVEFPRFTPYLGIGWGHQSAQPGWGFVFDLGASIGKARLRHQVSGLLADQLATPQGQADLDRQLNDLNNDVGKIKFIPQISIGVSYRF